VTAWSIDEVILKTVIVLVIGTNFQVDFCSCRLLGRVDIMVYVP